MNGLNWTLFGHLPRLYALMDNQEEQILRNSLYDKSPFKKILSPLGKKLLIRFQFDNNLEEKECPIDLQPFEKGEFIIKLPCQHIFKELSIINWLETQNALCPICRYELPSIEVKNTDDIKVNENFVEEDIIENRLVLLESLSRLTNLHSNTI